MNKRTYGNINRSLLGQLDVVMALGHPYSVERTWVPRLIPATPSVSAIARTTTVLGSLLGSLITLLYTATECSKRRSSKDLKADRSLDYWGASPIFALSTFITQSIKYEKRIMAAITSISHKLSDAVHHEKAPVADTELVEYMNNLDPYVL